jgi:predicted O-methyltransferase YrrM
LETLSLQLRQKVADIGARGGYFSLLFADAGGREGQVFAVDTNPDTDQLARQIFRSVL